MTSSNVAELAITKKIKIYKDIEDAKNIITLLIENINNNDRYQKHILLLEQSDIQINNKKASVIKNTINNIKIYGSKSKPLFLARDIGILLGVSNINNMAIKYDNEEKLIGYTSDNKSKKVIFLTQYGFYRTFFLSKSPLAKLFRTFIYELIDHISKCEIKIVKKIVKKIITETPELVESGIKDLSNKLSVLEKQLLLKTQESDKWESIAKVEYETRLDAEKDRDFIDIDNSYNQMQIEQIKLEKDIYLKKLSDVLLDDTSNDKREVYMIKKLYMKPMHIYIINPEYLYSNMSNLKYAKTDKILTKENSSTILDDEISSDIEEDVKSHGYKPKLARKSVRKSKKPFLSDCNTDGFKDPAINILTVEDIKDYEKKYNAINTLRSEIFLTDIIDKNINNILSDELMYFTVLFSKNKSAKPELLHIGTEWVINKHQFDKIISSLGSSCTTMSVCKNINNIFYSNYNEILEITQRELFNN